MVTVAGNFLIRCKRYTSNNSPFSYWYVAWLIRLISLGMATSLGEGKLVKLDLKIDLVLHPARGEEILS